MYPLFQEVTKTFDKVLGLPPDFQWRLLSTALILLAVWLMRWIVLKLIQRGSLDIHARYRWRRVTSYIAWALIVLLVGRVWFTGFQSLFTYLGLLSAGLAFALKDLIQNFFGWLFIISRRPFTVGDRIEIGGHAGDVIDQRIFQFTLLEIGNWVEADQSTGRIIHVPNGRVFVEPLYNFYSGFEYIWSEISFTVTFESDWKQAKQILQNIALEQDVHRGEYARDKIRRASEHYLIFYTKLTPIVFTSVRENGVALTIRYLTEPRRRRTRDQQLWEAALEAFANYPEIQFAYPTYRLTRDGGAAGPRVDPPGGPLPAPAR